MPDPPVAPYLEVRADDKYDILGMQRYITMTVELIDMTVDSSNTMHDYFTKEEVLAELAEQDRYQAGSWLIISV